MERQDHGVTIRNPATANLLIDSTDATSGYSADFQISKNNSILNGFFTRMAVSEVLLNWGIPNVISLVNNTFTVIVNGPGGPTTYTVTLPQAFYTVQAALDALVVLLNAAQVIAVFSITQVGSNRALSSTVAYKITPTTLSAQLNFYSPTFFSSVRYNY